MKRNFISWCRHKHFNSLPTQEVHYVYLGIVDMIQGYSDSEEELFPMDMSLKDAWSRILAAINTLKEKDLEHISNNRIDRMQDLRINP